MILKLKYHSIIKEIDLSGYIFMKFIKIGVYIDDIAILAWSSQDLKETFKRFGNCSREISLEINENKLKYFAIINLRGIHEIS